MIYSIRYSLAFCNFLISLCSCFPHGNFGPLRQSIIVWLQVRILPAPPRTLSNLGISRFAPKGPELAGCAVGAVVSAETNSGVEEISAELSLALKSGCPATETVVK
jgi:hypothetical protein